MKFVMPRGLLSGDVQEAAGNESVEFRGEVLSTDIHLGPSIYPNSSQNPVNYELF